MVPKVRSFKAATGTPLQIMRPVSAFSKPLPLSYHSFYKSILNFAPRCIPKMDHHCPWTANCVSHFTFPHFLRSVFYAVISMIYLEYFLYIRVALIWHRRYEPSVSGSFSCVEYTFAAAIWSRYGADMLTYTNERKSIWGHLYLSSFIYSSLRV